MPLLATFLLFVTAQMGAYAETAVSFSWRFDSATQETCEAAGQAVRARLAEQRFFYPAYSCVEVPVGPAPEKQ